MKNDNRASLRVVAILAVVFLAACGGETKTGSTGTGAVATEREEAFVAGTLASADPFSIGGADIVTSAASIRKDEVANAGEGALRLGMNLEGAGTVPATSGAVPVVLREGRAQSAVRGAVRSVDAAANRFTVATLTFIVDGNTLYDGVAGIAALTPGTNVEVSGLPLADPGTVLATRVTQTPNTDKVVPLLPALAPAAGTRVEIEGIALNVATSGGFVLRTPARDYDVAPGATFSAPVTSGARVRVVALATGASSLASASVTVIGGQIVYRVTGAISEFSSLAALRVRGEPVDLTTAVIRGGSASDIANGRRLAIVGTAGPGALRVSEATLQ